MNIFLTGATGVAGTRALPALVAAGHTVTAVARGEAKADLVRGLGAKPVTVDLFDPAAVAAAVAGHDAVVNLATSIPPLSRSARMSAWATNERLRTEASRHLVDAALAAGARRFVQESIAYPYRDNGADWITEEHPMDFVGPFAGAAHAERNAARVTDAGGAGVVLRFGQFYADDADHTLSFNALARRWRRNPFLGDPGGYVSLVHAEDVGAAAVAALGAAAGTYNVADDEPLTRAEAGRVLADTLELPRLRPVPRLVRALLPSNAKLLMRSQRISNAALKRATGWSPRHPTMRGSWPASGNERDSDG